MSLSVATRVYVGVTEAAALNLRQIPLALLWTLAVAMTACFGGVLFWIMPPRLSVRSPGLSVALGSALPLVAAAFSRDPRMLLWFCAVGFPAAVLPLLWLGKLPDGLPAANDPAIRKHPQYTMVVRRGRIAGFVLVALVLGVLIGTAIFVRGS